MAEIFTVGASLLDAIVLSVVAKEETYGYKITQDIRTVMNVSESTLYPVLRRLQKEQCLLIYDKEFAGRNRRYYQVTHQGTQKLQEYEKEWMQFKRRIDTIFCGGIENG